MEKEMPYQSLAEIYDLVYSWKDYEKEANKVRALIKKYKKSKGNDLLEVACGTGKHLQYMKQWFNCTGVDLSQKMLDVAKKNVKGVEFRKADMTTLNLNKQFDVVSSLFSSIGYVKTYKNLEKTIHNFSMHLKAGGIVIIEPWFTKGNYRSGSVHMVTYDGKDTKIARLNTTKAVGNLSIMDMHYLVAQSGKEIRHFVDRHELGLFDTDKILQYMTEAGLQAKYTKNGLMKGRGLFIGIKK